LHEECGNSQVAAELNKKKGGDPRAIGASFQRSFGSCVATITTLVARPSAHRGEAQAGVALLSRRKKVLNRCSSSVVEALASLALDSQGRPSFQLVAKVKNGFVSRIRNELFPVLKALQTAQCPMPRHRWTFSPPWGMEDLN
jgi:hypothetical protein